jgi:addiction module RelE/StbE family toxin
VKIVWTLTARADLHEIFDYILQENPQAAIDVIDRIEHLARHLVDHPGMGRPGRVENTRELIIPGLPYILPYLTSTGVITIVRVIHSSVQWPHKLD